MLDRVDDFIARVERGLLLASVAMMTLLIGVDVAQRTFSRPVGRTEALLLWLAEKLAGPLSDDARATLVGPIATAVFLGVAAGFFVAAARTAQRADGGARTWSAAVRNGLVALAAVAGAVKLLLVLFPSSVPGAQKFALGFMLWAGMLGASLATRSRRHIVLDPIVKKLDSETRKRSAFVGGLTTAAACGFVTVLSLMQFGGEFSDWREGEGVGLYPALPIPMWIATLAVPVSFATMTFRFLKNALQDRVHGPPSTADAHSVDLEALKSQAIDAGEAAAEVQG